MELLKRILGACIRPTPFKAGLLAVAAVLAINFFAPQTVQRFIRAVDEHAQDLMFRVRGVVDADKRDAPFHAVVVDIDEKSLERLGQWPWPRTLVAELLRRIDAGGPKAIGLDMVFAEADRTSIKSMLPRLKRALGRPEVEIPREDLPWLAPDEVAALLQELLGTEAPLDAEALAQLDHDAILARVIEETPTVVLGYFFSFDPDAPPTDLVPYGGGVIYWPRDLDLETQSPFRTEGRKGLIPIRPILNLPLLDDAAFDRCGSFSTAFDESGKVRAVPLVWEYEGQLYESLALRMIRLGLGKQTAKVHVRKRNIEFVEMDDLTLSTDKVGRLYANFRGPGRTFPYVSAADVLDGTVDPGLFRDRYVLLGTSAGGLLDLRVNPFDAAFPGVEVHATVIDNILEGDYLVQPPDLHALELLAIVVFGVLAAAALAYTRPLVGSLVFLALFAILAGGAYTAMFREHMVLNVAYPAISLVTVYMTVMLFNFFFEGRQKRFIKSAFGTYLSPTLVEQLVEDPRKLSLEGEAKELTVLFSDIRGFTSISEKLTAPELSQLLNEYLTPMSNIVMETRGTVDKFIGDAVVAFWNAPLDDAEHPVHAARAALRMIAALRELRVGWDARGVPPIEIGVGLNTGMVSVGNMGSESRFDYTVMGDNVNLGSRLEGLNKQYGTSILLSGATRERLPEAFLCREVDLVRVKGKEEPVRIFELLAGGAVSEARRTEVERFEEALAQYRARRFDTAEAILRELAGSRPHPLYEVYRERIETFRNAPPPPDWDGVFTFTTK
jgi:adenylate cyclase